MPTSKKKIVSTKFAENLYNLLVSLVPKTNPCSLVSNNKKDVHTMLFRDEENGQTYLLSIKPFTKEEYEKQISE